MIVDDQDFFTTMIRRVIKVIGASDVKTFTDGETAWKEYKLQPPDLVILDWEMRPMNGLQLTTLIRKSPESPNPFVPIIMVTAHREREHVFKARDTGVTEYVVKPIVPKALFSRIEAVIERPRRFVRVGDFFGPDRRRHKKTFDGEDRRGTDAPGQAQAAAPKSDEKTREMAQEEINNTFNPDDVPASGG